MWESACLVWILYVNVQTPLTSSTGSPFKNLEAADSWTPFNFDP